MMRCLVAAAMLLPTCANAQQVSIGVFTLFHPTELLLTNEDKSTVVVRGGGNEMVLSHEPGHSSVLVQLDHGRLLLNRTPVTSLQATSRSGEAVDFTLSVPGRIARHYRGVLRITAAPAALEPVVAMQIETAVASVVAAENSPSTPLEAMKAQAVAARSFFHAGGPHAAGLFCDTTHCQFLRDPPPPASRAWAATRETRGLVLAWHGQPLAAMYSSRCGGTTKTLQQIGVHVRGYPYFAVDCVYCRRHPDRWTRTLSAADARILPGAGELGRLAAGRQRGWSAVPSNHYEIDARGLTLHGQGRGHGLGLCQYGAAGMAAEGADFTTILRHYYSETELVSIPVQTVP